MFLISKLFINSEKKIMFPEYVWKFQVLLEISKKMFVFLNISRFRNLKNDRVFQKREFSKREYFSVGSCLPRQFDL